MQKKQYKKNKISKDIKIGKDEIGKIIFRPDDHSVNWIENLVLSNFKKLKKFYKINVSKINLELIYSRKEFNDKINRQTPRWMVGITFKNKIYLLSPFIIEKVSTHKKSELNKIITHELCHIFNNKINKNSLIWVDEGIALFLAKQKKKKDFKKAEWQFFINNFLIKNIDFWSFVKYNGYKISYWTIKTSTNKIGAKNLLDLIKINAKKNNCKNKLEKVLGVSIEDFLKL